MYSVSNKILEGLSSKRGQVVESEKVNPKEIAKIKKLIDKGDRYFSFVFNDLKKRNKGKMTDEEIMQVLYNSEFLDN
jgi:hypothetical protein